jgi:hypothetical protein
LHRRDSHCDYHRDILLIAYTYETVPGDPFSGFTGRIDESPQGGWILDGCDRPNKSSAGEKAESTLTKSVESLDQALSSLNQSAARCRLLRDVTGEIATLITVAETAAQSAMTLSAEL